MRHRGCARNGCHSLRLADGSAVGADRAKAYGYALYCGRDARYVTSLRRLRTWSYTHVRLTPSAPRMHAYTHAEVQAPQTRPSCAAAHMRAVDGDPDQSVARKRAATAVVAGKASLRRGRRRLSRIVQVISRDPYKQRVTVRTRVAHENAPSPRRQRRHDVNLSDVPTTSTTKLTRPTHGAPVPRSDVHSMFRLGPRAQAICI